ncbi:MAG: PIN domain nuclease [bacterium]|nr:PIN domain nuclease [bacterium]
MPGSGLVLIDSSPWILALRPKGSTQAQGLVGELLEHDRAATTGMIVTELLQGARNEGEYQDLSRELGSLHYLPFADEDWEMASQLGYRLIRAGLKIPITDIIIAHLAIKHRCMLLHADRHFELMAKETGLEQKSIKT